MHNGGIKHFFLTHFNRLVLNYICEIVCNLSNVCVYQLNIMKRRRQGAGEYWIFNKMRSRWKLPVLLRFYV